MLTLATIQRNLNTRSRYVTIEKTLLAIAESQSTRLPQAH